METISSCILCGSGKTVPFCPTNYFCRCADCGHFFDNPRPDKAEIESFYAKETQYDDWLRELPARDALWRRRLRLVLRHRTSGKLLDAGAGIGQFLSVAKNHFEVFGTEFSDVAIGLAKSHYQLNLRKGALEDLSWPHKFDVITLFHVLEHVPSPKETLTKCYALLETNGILAIAVPNDVDSILTRRNRWMRKLGFRKYQSLGNLGMPRQRLDFSELHLSHFTAETLARSVQAAGFTVLENSMDPYYSVSGLSRKVRRFLRFQFYKAVALVTGKNFYDTIWLVAVVP